MLCTAVRLRFDEFQALPALSGNRRKAIRDRGVLDSAKRILMMHERLAEQDAFCHM
jgi:AmiR/NasT family two-component response regulator